MSMAASSSNSCTAGKSSQHGIRLNDAVFEMYRPKTGSIELEIIFFHGFPKEDGDEAYFRTWMKKDDSECWLNTLLADSFPQSHILSMYYGAGITASSYDGAMDAYLLGENLAQSLIDLAGIGQNCPVILVGHCVGGLILKEVCLKADMLARDPPHLPGYKYSNFLANLKATVFYGTPHFGSEIRPRPDLGGPLLQYLQKYNLASTRINNMFSTLRRRYNWESSGVCETNATTEMKDFMSYCLCLVKRTFLGLLFPWSPVVEEQSARYDMDGFIVLPGTDHYDVCKPSDQNSTSFLFLHRILDRICKNEAERNLQFKWMLYLPQVLLDTFEGDRLHGVIKKLRLQDSESLRLVLAGMSGIGKTTLAKQVVLKISRHFEFVCFVEDAKHKLASADLQTLIAKNLYRGVGTKVDLRANEDVLMLLRGKKVLMVVDDLDSENEIVDLSKSKWPENGSRLIVTSRNHRVLKGAIIHEVPFLSKAESQALFEAHIETGRPAAVPMDLAKQIVERCDGLPLALEVIGSYLSEEKKVSSWTDALHRLEEAQSLDGNGQDDRLWRKLRVSYDKLGEIEQEMFLDITAFDMFGSKLTHYSVDVLEAALNTRPDRMSSHVTLCNLEKRSFIRLIRDWRPTVEDTTIVYIHQQLRDMGKNINRPRNQLPECCRGLWNIKDASFMLEKYEGGGVPRTQILSLNVDDKKESTSSSSSVHNIGLHLSSKSFAKLGRLRLLRMSNVTMKDLSSPSRFPWSLVMLHMINCSKPRHLKRKWLENSEYWPKNEYWPIREEDVQGLHQLRVLLINNCNPVRFPSNFQELRNLTILQVQVSDKALRILPEKIGLLPALKQIFIEIAGLEELPVSLLESTSLQTMTIKNCISLRTLPKLNAAPNISQHGYSLTHLRLVDLPGLEKLPESLVEMKSLQRLKIDYCTALVELPKNFGEIKSLERLEIRYCTALVELPKSFGELRQLRELRISCCPNIRALPESFGQLPQLFSLDIQHCHSLESLGHSFGSVLRRKDQELTNIPELSSTPATLGHFATLGRLHIAYCPALRTSPENFQSLQDLFLQGCDGSLVRSIMEHGRGSPGSVRASDAMSSCDAAVFGSQSPPKTWQELDRVHHMETHRPLPMFGLTPGHCDKLTAIELCGIADLKYIPEGIERYRRVRDIYIIGCKDLEGLPEGLGQLTELRALGVGLCEKVKSLPDSLGDAINLERLTVYECATFEHVPISLGKLLKLDHLKITECENFRGLQEGLRQILELRSCKIMID